MIRSVLYVPADRPKMLVKAAQRQADLVLVDLEDAVAVGSKKLAREQARRAIPRLKEEGARVGVRINSHTDHMSADLEALADWTSTRSWSPRPIFASSRRLPIPGL